MQRNRKLVPNIWHQRIFFLAFSLTHLKIPKPNLFQLFTNIRYQENIAVANFPCHNLSPLPLSLPRVDTENRPIPYTAALQRQLQATIVYLDFCHLFSTKLSNSHSPRFLCFLECQLFLLTLCICSTDLLQKWVPKQDKCPPEVYRTRVDDLRI